MEKNKKKIVVTVIISIIIAIVYELFLKYVLKVASAFFIDKIIVDSMILFFIALHFVVGISKLYDFIAENRYKIAGILLILFTLLQYSGSSNGILANWILEPDNNNTLWGYARESCSEEYEIETLLATSQKENMASGIGLAFWWNFRFFALILISFELCMIITNKNKKISCCGSILITFSGVCQWCFSHHLVDILIWGQCLVVLLDKFLLSKEYKYKVLYSIGMSISIIFYIFTQYPAWMISFGYVFLSLIIWIMIKNRKEYKINKKDVLLILINVIIIVGICYRYFVLFGEILKIISNTSYQGNRIENGGNGITFLFSYLYNFLLPFKNLGDNYALSSIISIFPIPMIIAIYYVYKKEKHVSFLLPMSIVAVLETVFCLSGFPEIISKITLFKYVIVERAAVAVSFANFYILFYMLANIQEDFAKIKSAVKIAIIVMCVIIFVPLPESIATRRYLSLISSILCVFTFLFLNNGDSRYRKVLLGILVIFTVIGGVFVNPITKGTYAVTETNLAKKIQEISSKDKEAVWMSLDNMMILANYAVANGAKTINSTHIYPNAELFEQVLETEKAEEQKDLWNRYAHIEITLDKENSVELVDKDKIKLHITLEKMKELGIDYIITYENEKEMNDKEIEVEILYENKISEPIVINGKEEKEIYIYKIVNSES